MPQTKEQIKEEFKQREKFWDDDDDNIADWWLSKIETLLKEERERLVEKIEKTDEHVCYGWFCEQLEEKQRIINLIKEDK